MTNAPDWRRFVRERLPPTHLAAWREAEVIEELSQQLEDRYLELCALGMDDDAARAAAEAQFPHWAELASEIRTACRPISGRLPDGLYMADSAAWGRKGKRRFMADFLDDVRYAIRLAARQPGFTTVVLLTLAIGIGANIAIFSALNAVVLKPLSYLNPDQLVMLWEQEKDGTRSNVGYPTFFDWRNQARSFESMAAMAAWTPAFSGDNGEPESLEGASVTADFFKTLGASPLLGRDFTSEDDRPNQARVAIIGYRLWQRRFAGDPNIIGKTILLNGVDRTVIGVMSAGFQPLLSYRQIPIEIWRPLAYAGEAAPACRDCRHLRVVGRMRAGFSREQARAELDAIFSNMRREHPTDYASVGVIHEPLQEEFSGQSRNLLLILFGTVGCVLLVACTNVSGLMLARSVSRRRDVSLRVALGAGRIRMLRQLLTESLLLAGAGGSLGVFVAYAGGKALATLSPIRVPRLDQASSDPATIAFAAAIILLSGILFGLAPALSAIDGDVYDAIKEGARGSGGHRSTALRETMVVVNVALAIVLLTGAGLMMRSFIRLFNVDTGFSPQNVVTMQLTVFGPQYGGNDGTQKVHATFSQVLDRVRTMHGVRSAGMVSQLPLGENGDMYGMAFKDKPLGNPADAPSGDRYCVTPGYIEAMGIRLIRGRTLTEADNAQTQPVVLINDAVADKIWPGEDPIGKSVHVGETLGPWRTVVGVVHRVRHERLDENNRFQFYAPTTQWSFADTSLTLAVRSDGNAAELSQAVREAIHSINPNILIDHVATMNTVIENSARDRRFATLLLSLFAIISVLLAGIGLYGLMAFTVAQRIPEFGLRLALGAQPSEMVRRIVKRGMALAAWGVSLGIVLAVLLSRYLETLLFQVAPHDPLTLTVVAAFLCFVAVAACWVPARRAARVDPLVALRHE